MTASDDNQSGEDRRDPASLIVAVAASSAARDSLDRLLANLSPQPDQAVIVLTDWRDGSEEHALRQKLQRLSHNVKEPRDQGLIEGGAVYLCTAGKITTVDQGKFRVRRGDPPPGRGAVDSLLVSLAQTRTAAQVDDGLPAGTVRAEQSQLMILAELQHRVRNTLGVIRSIARRSARTSETVEEYAAHLDGRLTAYARTQAMLTHGPAGGVDLESIVVEELAACSANEDRQVVVTGPSIRLQLKGAEVFVLAIHELATNAVKYGSLSVPTGQVSVSWEIEPGSPQLLSLVWRERGGPPVKPPQRQGFGTEFLERTLAFEFGAKTTLTFDPVGVTCSIVVPFSAKLVQSSVAEDHK